MIAELQTLLSARSKLDNPETSMQAKASLKRLADEGVFVQVSAAISYARVALNPDEKREALTLLSSLQERQPEQAQLIEPELRRLKGLSS
ncbi:MAG: hypothetical protein GYA55_04935 [SAR324 cluster bacterium]|uniref:HEAT repeat domain-containing protein n=1 Tax=SAR324 cluster bacterium TaxID=2024889 RepID=A0A7X9FQL2_9DELT|nr:hypothetical protein [SAR324 cluster bacterium]